MAEKTMKVKVISPERVFYEGEVTFMEFNTIEGIIGIYPMHIPTTVVIYTTAAATPDLLTH